MIRIVAGGLFIYLFLLISFPGKSQTCHTILNINHDGISDNNIEKSIGDCVFNPFMNHFLVSEYGDFESSPAVIRVIDGADNTHVQDIGLVFGNVNAQYPREMFISPEGKLYVMVNMHRDDQTAPPKIFELSAFDNGTGTAYSLLNAYDVNMPSSSGEEFDCYSAHFCYNSFNQTVYVTVHLTELALDPYNTVVNSMFNFAPPTDVYFPNGKFIGIKNGQKPTDIPLFYPGKVICPGTEYPQIPTVFNKKMYIIGKQFYEFDPVVNAYQVLITETFNDITYSPYHDKMFAIKDTFTIDCTNQRICEIYSIDNVDDEINYTLLESFPGQFSGITYNPYDSKVYLYRKTDDAKLGDTPVQIIWFDPGADPIEFITVDCPFRGSNPEYDHDPDHHYYFYNISKPYIDPVNKFIYFPNGAHSSVTRMEFEADETVPLDPSRLTWMSFPRLNRTPQNPTVNDVLGGENIDPSNYLPDSYLQTLPPGLPDLVASTYTGTSWPSVTFLSEIDSRQGYKLQLEYDPENLPDKEWIHLFGEVLPAATEVQVYRQYDNWTGYWLYEKQSPFDAFPSPALDELRSIIHQNWVCAKYGYENPPDGQEPPYYWLCGCHKGKVQLSYGDMVILKTHDGNGTFNFQWQRYGNPIGGKERPEAEYFSYTEQAEYTPYLVELDTTQLPSEIGAFVNDTCVGATTVMEGDTLVLVPGYVDGMNGEVSFELYYDSLKTGRKAHTDYLVRNPETSRWDRRVIHTGEKRDVFLISLKEKQQDQSLPPARLPVTISPNPATDRFSLEFILPVNGITVIECYDMFGRRVNTFSQGYLQAGFHRFNINLPGAEGQCLSRGVYLIHIRCEQFQGQAKLLLMK